MTATLDRAVEALSTYDLRSLARLYRDDVLFDANVPQWRYQLQGPAAILQMVEEELAELEGLAVTGVRAVVAGDLATVEVAVRFGSSEQEHRWREVHLLRGQDEAIAEHTVYCTGIWDPDAIARQAAEAPMVRP